MSLRISANISILYPSVPAGDRPRAAAHDGFAYVESWWPFADATGTEAEIDAFCGALSNAGVQLVALNLFAGDTAGGDRGLLSDPASTAHVAANLEAVADVLRRTGCRLVNALYGNRDPGVDADAQDRLAMSQLVAVADRLGEVGATAVIETLNLVDSPRFPLTDIAASADVVRRANELCRHGNVRLLFDTYHLATMGTDPVVAAREYAEIIGHVQFADFPGRGRPGTGGIDFAAVERELVAAGYDGFIGYEYDPAYQPEHTREGIA